MKNKICTRLYIKPDSKKASPWNFQWGGAKNGDGLMALSNMFIQSKGGVFPKTFMAAIVIVILSALPLTTEALEQTSSSPEHQKLSSNEPNYFDQFDEADSSNPYDQFDEVASSNLKDELQKHKKGINQKLVVTPKPIVSQGSEKKPSGLDVSGLIPLDDDGNNTTKSAPKNAPHELMPWEMDWVDGKPASTSAPPVKTNSPPSQTKPSEKNYRAQPKQESYSLEDVLSAPSPDREYSYEEVFGTSAPERITKIYVKDIMPDNCTVIIAFSGEIAVGDDRELRATVDRAKRLLPENCNKIKMRLNNGLVVHLNSKGGDVQTALALGYELRKEDAWVIVLHKGTCESSCVFLLAAGVDRGVSGLVGVHRPYLSELASNVTTAEINKKRNQHILLIRQFLSDMDVSSSLLEKMLSIAPEDMRYLTYEELVNYRLVGRDASYDEMMTARHAMIYGLTSAEYRSRNASAERQCDISSILTAKGARRYHICRDAILLNVSFLEAKKRGDRAAVSCKQLNKSDEIIACRSKVLRGL